MSIITQGTRGIVEWDWVCNIGFRKLHAPAYWDDPEFDGFVEDGRTVCGLTGYLTIPGIYSRMGLPRCKRCCSMTGMPHGNGSPKNSEDCRHIVEARLQKLIQDSSPVVILHQQL